MRNPSLSRRRGPRFAAALAAAGMVALNCCAAADAAQRTPEPLRLQPAGRLTVPTGFAPSGGLEESPAAAAAHVTGPMMSEGVEVFDRTPTGWSTSPALLALDDGDDLAPSAVSDDAVAADDASIGDSGPVRAYVFDRPVAGWTGTVPISATLIGQARGNGGIYGEPIALSDRDAFLATAHSVEVFTRRGSSWSGMLSPTARLRVTGREGITAIARAGDALVAMAGGRLSIFEKRHAGWAGVSRPVATLPAGDALAATEQAIITADVYSEPHGNKLEIYRRPRRGWSHVHAPTRVIAFRGEATVPEPMILASGATAVLQVNDLIGGIDHECPCGVGLYPFSLDRPPAALRSPAREFTNDDDHSALAGTTLLTAVDTDPAGTGQSLRFFDVTR